MKKIRSKVLALCIFVLAMLVYIIPASVFGASGSAPNSGTGTSADPYIIDQPTELVWISENFLTVKDSYFLQTSDIDMTSVANFTPIGNGTGSDIGTAFSGQYDGQKFKIKNLNINSNLACASLFQTLYGTVKNVVLENASIVSTCSTYNYGGAAGIAAYLGNGTIRAAV